MDIFTAIGAAIFMALALATIGVMCTARPGRADHVGDAFGVIFTFALAIGLIAYSPPLAGTIILVTLVWLYFTC